MRYDKSEDTGERIDVKAITNPTAVYPPDFTDF